MPGQLTTSINLVSKWLDSVGVLTDEVPHGKLASALSDSIRHVPSGGGMGVRGAVM